MSFKKRKEQINNNMANSVEAILPAEATLLYFSYDEKCFGNIVVAIEFENSKHTFHTDRGEIYNNGKMLCDYSYLYIEKVDTLTKVLQMIRQELCF